MKKRSIFAIGTSFVAIAVIGVTWAVSQDLATINNDLAVAGYQTTFTEEFSSPANWTTCQTVPKTITVTNNSDVDVAVRIKLDEDWIAADGMTHLPLASAASGFTMALINFTSNSGWTRDGAYYVYDTDLAPNATTNSLMTGVTMNCDANLSEDADGAYAGAEYHLKATIQTIQAGKKSEWHTLYNAIASQVNAPLNIDFTKSAVKSSDPAVANGNGVNKTTENGVDVYYYRGEIEDNNVIWADMCWKIIRTTATGGTKVLYNGRPTIADGAKQCLSQFDTDSRISVNIDGEDQNLFSFATNYSPADIGYMIGDRIMKENVESVNGITFVFSKKVRRNGSTYYLDTSDGQYITGSWSDKKDDAIAGFRYFCIDGASNCDESKVGYILGNVLDWLGTSTIRYLQIGGYDDLEDAKNAMFSNKTDSKAKQIIESWFEQNNLDGHIDNSRNYEDDLEDAVYCNDRRYTSGVLAGEDSASEENNAEYGIHAAYARNARKNSDNNYSPDLNCPIIRDAFTKDSSNGNGMLKHKIGLISVDELTLVGMTYHAFNNKHYLFPNDWAQFWSMSPADYFDWKSYMFHWNTYLLDDEVAPGNYAIHPMVSLKAGTEFASGTGLKTDPYIVP